MKITLVILSRG